MSYKLVIVESPAKAKTIGKYLPKGCSVTATMGHLIDLPSSKLGIDIENGYTPEYKTIKGKATTLKEIKKLSKGADEVILATDPDREGEVISYHLANYLGLDTAEKNRIEFHEITPNAIKNAMDNKRSIDMDLVDAQQARRVLDRLVGYQISPVLWKKVMRGLSAGRVQSAATRIIVDRETEIRDFVSTEYYNISTLLTKDGESDVFEARLTKTDGKKSEVNDAAESELIVKELESGKYTLEEMKTAQKKRNPHAPFTTSTLQQDAYRKLGMSTKKTMLIAQQLYEGLDIKGKGHIGLVSYIRTDSVRIADEAKQSAKEYITANYGSDYWAERVYGKKGKIQDAHEAIRPTDITLEPSSLEGSLNKDQLNLYRLIYNRFISSQMASAVYDTQAADISCGRHILHATGSKLKFSGYLKVYGADENNEEGMLPELTKGEILLLQKVVSEQKFTQPPARYTEASLVKALEELGIGRPSTYAPTISTILARNYVVLEDKKFVPTDLGEAVTKLMKENFEEIVDVGFTAEMENDLDKVAEGSENWVNVVDEFYKQLKEELDKADEIPRIKLPEVETDEKCEKCGRNLVIKMGRFGKFLACPGYPECSFTKPLVEKVDAKCPECGGDIILRKTKKGKTFYGCSSYPDCNFMSWNKPTDKKCPDCGAVLYEANGKNKTLFCADKECGYKES